MEGAFSGHFNGNGHTIKYKVDGATGKQGLFPCLNAAVVQNMTVVVDHTSSKDIVTGALSYRTKNSLIKNVAVEHTFRKGSDADLAAAGLSGVNEGTRIEGCRVVEGNAPEYSNYGGIAVTSNGRVADTSYIMAMGKTTISNFGGIAQTNTGTIANCTVYLPAAGIEGGITAGNDVGGICSVLNGGVIQDCYSTFHTESGGNNLGGVAANIISGTVTGCTVAGKIMGGTSLGGIAGSAGGSGTVTLRSCQVELASIGSTALRAGNYCAGLIGYLSAKTVVIEDCSSSASIYATTDCGGLIGHLKFSEGYTFALKNTNCYGEELLGSQGCGGVIGAVNVPAENPAGVSGTIENCETRMNVVATVAYNGGFIGYFLGYDFTITNCRAFGNVQSNESQGGGFIGRADCATGSTLLQNCAAYGTVNGVTSLGGFAGMLLGDGKLRFSDCAASGTVKGTGDHTGGFIGYNLNTGLTVTGSKATGAVYGSKNIGGFIGMNSGKNASFGGNGEMGCSAAGDVTAPFASGGFIGRSGAENTTWQNCVASGSLPAASSEAGGFAGAMASCVISNCTAFGDLSGTVAASAVGGFIGNTWDDVGSGFVQKNVVINNCVSYGNVSSASVRIGGFAGEIGSVSTDSMTNCVSYGTVTGTNAYVGGFAGNLTQYSSLIGCVSYGSAVTGKSAVGGLIGSFGSAQGQHTLSGNKYRTSLTACGTSATVTAEQAKTMTAAEVKVPPSVTVAMSASGSGTLLTVSFSGVSGYSVRDLSISTDGGKYFTDLVSGSVRYVNIDQASLNNCTNFTYVYAAEYVEADTVVSITITNGDTIITKIFRKRA